VAVDLTTVVQVGVGGGGGGEQGGAEQGEDQQSPRLKWGKRVGADTWSANCIPLPSTAYACDTLCPMVSPLLPSHPPCPPPSHLTCATVPPRCCCSWRMRCSTSTA
jgi:hypothetical protein